MQKVFVQFLEKKSISLKERGGLLLVCVDIVDKNKKCFLWLLCLYRYITYEVRLDRMDPFMQGWKKMEEKTQQRGRSRNKSRRRRIRYFGFSPPGGNHMLSGFMTTRATSMIRRERNEKKKMFPLALILVCTVFEVSYRVFSFFAWSSIFSSFCPSYTL